MRFSQFVIAASVLVLSVNVYAGDKNSDYKYKKNYSHKVTKHKSNNHKSNKHKASKKSVHKYSKDKFLRFRPFLDLKNRIEALESMVTTIQGQIDSLVAKVDSMDGRVSANEAAIVLLQDQNMLLNAELQNSSETIDSLQAQIDNLELINAGFQVLVEAGDSSLQSQIDENNLLISEFNLSIANLGDLQNQIDSNLVLIDAMQQEIEALNGMLVMKQNIINGTCSTGYSIREIRQDGTVGCEYDDGSSGGSGGAIQYVEYLGYRYLGANASGEYFMTCPAGWIAINSSHWGWNFYLHGSYVAGQKGHVRVANQNSYYTYFIQRATCMKVT